MIYSSTRGSDINLKFGDVLLNGLAKDGGLYDWPNDCQVGPSHSPDYQ